MAKASISITAPGSVQEGAKVSASVTVKNITEYHYSFKGDIEVLPEHWPGYVISSIDQVIKSGVSVTRSFSFTMPDCDVTIYIWLKRWSVDHWTYDNSSSKVIALEIPALPPPPPPPPPPPSYIGLPWIGNIFDFVWDFFGWFKSVAELVPGWIDVWGWFSTPFLLVYSWRWLLLNPIAHFWLWAEDVATKIVAVWTSDGILGLIKWWFPDLGNVIEWFIGRWNWFISAVGDWWETTKPIVLGWIDIVKQWAIETFDATVKGLVELKENLQWFFDHLMTFGEIIQWWKDWLGGVLAAIIKWGFATLLDVTGLIVTAFIEREDFWAGWQDWRDNVAEFFEDPLDFLAGKLEDWFWDTKEDKEE